MVRTPIASRRGISLIEILMSIGVATIGVLGVASLIPAAMHQSVQGTRRDRASLIGQRALREFRVRGMDNPQSWLTMAADGSVLPVSPTGDLPGPNSPLLPAQLQAPRFGPLTQAPLDVAVLDPLGVGYYSAAAASRPLASIVPADLHPSYPAGNRLRRFTIRSSPTGIGQLAPIQLSHARAIFETQDDLAFSVSESDNSSPAQMQFWGASGAQVAVVEWPNDFIKKRYADGRYSWFATLVPERGSDQYVLSVAVAHDRDFGLDNASTGVRASGERWAMLPQGILAGGATFQVDATDPTALDSLKSGHWVLVVEQYLRPDNRPQRHARWYRVAQVNHLEGSPLGEYSLDGPDWPLDSRAAGQSRLTAIIFKNVIDVYERIVRLNSDGTWIETGQL